MLAPMSKYLPFALSTLVSLTSLLLSISLQARDIKMTTSNWAPFYSEELSDGGPITELVVEAFRRSGHQASIEFQPWARALQSGKSSDIDVIMGAYYTKNRAKTFLYSRPILAVDVAIIASKKLGITSYDALSELSQFTFGIGKGWANSPEFDSASYLKKETARNQSINVRKLIYGRLDMIVISSEVYHYEIRKQNLQHQADKFQALTPMLSKACLHLLINKQVADHRELIDGFNQAIQGMKEDGSYLKILKKHGISESAAEFSQ